MKCLYNMSRNSLRSHEDLSGYLDALDITYNSFQSSIRSAPSFSADPQSIIEDLLSQLVNSRRKGLEVIKIARKFYKVSEDSSEQSRTLQYEKDHLETEISELFSKINSQMKEIEAKESRIEIMSQESTEIEADYKLISQEVQQLRKEVQMLKKDNSKGQQPTRISSQRANQDFEEYKNLRESLEDYKQEAHRKAGEIEDLQAQLKSLDTTYSLEKSSNDRLKSTIIALKKENLELKDKIDELEFENNYQKEEINNVNNELIKQKNYTEGIVKEYDKERRSSSIAIGMSNELMSLIEDQNKREGQESPDSPVSPVRARAQLIRSDTGDTNSPKYKSKAPKMENLADIIGTDSEFDEDEEKESVGSTKFQKFMAKGPGKLTFDHTRRNTMFVLTSPVVNYERKFQFPGFVNSEFEIELQGSISVFQEKNYAKETFDLSKSKKNRQVFIFDYDETGQGTTPVKSCRTLSVQSFDTVNVARVIQPLSVFVSNMIIAQGQKNWEVAKTENFDFRRIAKNPLSVHSFDTANISIIQQPLSVFVSGNIIVKSQKNWEITEADNFGIRRLEKKQLSLQSFDTMNVARLLQPLSVFASSAIIIKSQKNLVITEADNCNIKRLPQKSLSVQTFDTVKVARILQPLSVFISSSIAAKGKNNLAITEADRFSIRGLAKKALSFQSFDTANVTIMPRPLSVFVSSTIIVKSNRNFEITGTDHFAIKKLPKIPLSVQYFDTMNVSRTLQPLSVFISNTIIAKTQKNWKITETDHFEIRKLPKNLLSVQCFDTVDVTRILLPLKMFVSNSIIVKSQKNFEITETDHFSIRKLPKMIFSVQYFDTVDVARIRLPLKVFASSPIIIKSKKNFEITEAKNLGIKRLAKMPLCVQSLDTINAIRILQPLSMFVSNTIIAKSQKSWKISETDNCSIRKVDKNPLSFQYFDTVNAIRVVQSLKVFASCPIIVKSQKNWDITKIENFSIRRLPQKALSFQFADDVNVKRVLQPLSVFFSSTTIAKSEKNCEITKAENICVRRLAKKSLQVIKMLDMQIIPERISRKKSSSMQTQENSNCSIQRLETFDIIRNQQEISLSVNSVVIVSRNKQMNLSFGEKICIKKSQRNEFFIESLAGIQILKQTPSISILSSEFQEKVSIFSQVQPISLYSSNFKPIIIKKNLKFSETSSLYIKTTGPENISRSHETQTISILELSQTSSMCIQIEQKGKIKPILASITTITFSITQNSNADTLKKSPRLLTISQDSETIIISSNNRKKLAPWFSIDHSTEFISIRSNNYLNFMPKIILNSLDSAIVCSISPTKQGRDLNITDSRLQNELSIESQCEYSIISEQVTKNTQSEVDYNDKKGKIKNFSLFSESYSRDPIKDFFILVLLT